MNKKFLIVVAVASTLLLASTSIAKAGLVDDLMEIPQVKNLIPPRFRDVVKGIAAGKAVGVGTIATLIKPADENENIDEDVWQEIDKAGLEISNDRTVAKSGVGAQYFISKLAESALKNIDNVNNNKARNIEKKVIEERPKIQQVLKDNSKPAESTLEAENQRNKMLAATAAIEQRRLDLESRTLTANQVRNAIALDDRKEKSGEKLNQDINNQAQRLKNADLTNAILNPYYGEK
jgi:hypothetical protein